MLLKVCPQLLCVGPINPKHRSPSRPLQRARPRRRYHTHVPHVGNHSPEKPQLVCTWGSRALRVRWQVLRERSSWSTVIHSIPGPPLLPPPPPPPPLRESRAPPPAGSKSFQADQTPRKTNDEQLARTRRSSTNQTTREQMTVCHRARTPRPANEQDGGRTDNLRLLREAKAKISSLGAKHRPRATPNDFAAQD